MNNVVYVSAHDENGGIYQHSLTDDNSGSIEKIVNNGASICNKVHSLTMYSDVFAFSDIGDSSIKVYNLSEQTCSVVVGNGEGTKMLSIECCLPKIQRDVSMLATQIVCALTSYNYHDDVVEQEESDLILLLDELQHTNEVVTIAEAAEMTEAAAS